MLVASEIIEVEGENSRNLVKALRRARPVKEGDRPMNSPSRPAASPGRTVQIRDFKSLAKNTLHGVFSATLPSGMVIHGLTLHEREGRRWIGLPAREYIDQTGGRQFARIIEFINRTTADRFQAAALEALDRHLGKVQ
jgi:hypothetical protein